MGPEEAEKLLQRRRRTIYLLAGGTVSLLLPLAGVAYLKMQAPAAASGPAGSLTGVFDHRDADASRYVKAPELPPPAIAGVTPKPSAAGRSGSMDFINVGRDLRPEQQPPPQKTEPPKEQPVPTEEPTADKKAAASKKPVSYPKLKRIDSGAAGSPGFSEKTLGRSLRSE